MIASRMIPALWFRLIVLVGFILFMAWESMWILCLVGLGLLALSGWQLRTAYQQRGTQARE